MVKHYPDNVLERVTIGEPKDYVVEDSINNNKRKLLMHEDLKAFIRYLLKGLLIFLVIIFVVLSFMKESKAAKLPPYESNTMFGEWIYIHDTYPRQAIYLPTHGIGVIVACSRNMVCSTYLQIDKLCKVGTMYQVKAADQLGRGKCVVDMKYKVIGIMVDMNTANNIYQRLAHSKDVSITLRDKTGKIVSGDVPSYGYMSAINKMRDIYAKEDNKTLRMSSNN